MTSGYYGMYAKRVSKLETILMAELCPLDIMIVFTCSPVLVTNGVTKQFSHGPTWLQIIFGTPPQKIGFTDECTVGKYQQLDYQQLLLILQ